MKKYSKYIILIFTFYNSVFAGIDFSLFVPFGMNLSALEKSIDNRQPYLKNVYEYMFYSTGILSEIGYNFKLNNRYINSISILGTIGYTAYSLPIEYSMYTSEIGTFYEVTFLHTLTTGVSIKMVNHLTDYNFSYSVGIGGGVKTPFSGDIISQLATVNESFLTGKEYYDFSDIKKVFKNAVIPYIKFDVNLYYHISKNVSFMAGVYINYNFALKYNTDYINNYLIENIGSKMFNKLEVSSLSAGISLGFAIRDNGY